jgi:hypothetical protein
MRRRFAAWLAAALVVVLLAPPVAAKPTDERRARVAVRYLASVQEANGSIPAFSPVGSTADAVQALVAARRGARVLDDAITFLRRQVRSGAVGSLGLKAKVVLAAVAAGKDPRRFGGADLIADLEASLQPSGQYGDGSDGIGVSTHTLVMLALAAAGEQVAPQAAEWLAAAQCGDGGWQFDEPAADTDDEHCQSTVSGSDFSQSDTNTTAYAVQALEAVGAEVDLAADPFAFFADLRDPIKNGWGFDRSFPLTDSNSTALVIQAYEAAGLDVPAGGRRALRALQYPLCRRHKGAFAFTWVDEDNDGVLERGPADAGATIGAILGLTGSLPVAPFEVTRPAPRLRAC